MGMRRRKYKCKVKCECFAINQITKLVDEVFFLKNKTFKRKKQQHVGYCLNDKLNKNSSPVKWLNTFCFAQYIHTTHICTLKASFISPQNLVKKRIFCFSLVRRELRCVVVVTVRVRFTSIYFDIKYTNKVAFSALGYPKLITDILYYVHSIANIK